jgi:EmrB/QacA subfamily drug resistance transporter
MTTSPTIQTSPHQSRAMLPVIMVALAAVVSAVASLNVALPSVARDTGASQTQLSWIVDAYALVFAALLLLGGAVGDRYGRRRALLVGLAVFGSSSLAAMFIDSPDWLIVLRGLLGVGAALVMPATLSTITSTFPAEQRARAVGTWAGVAGGSAILGLVVSGLLLEQWSWRSVFAVNVVLSVVALVATARVIPESADESAPRLDITGALLTVVGLGLTIYSVIQAPLEGWHSAQTLAEIAAGVGVLVVFVLWELTRAHPLINPRLFTHRAFSAGVLSVSLQFFAFYGFIFLMLQYLQLVRGERPLVAALSLVPMTLTLMPSARVLSPRLTARIGPAAGCLLGLALIVAGLLVLGHLSQSSSYWLMLAGLIPLGAGMGLAMTPATSAITEALPRAQQGVGSAMNDLARELGGALGIAVVGSLQQTVYREDLALPGLPPEAADQARSSLAAASRLGASVSGRAQAAFVDGLQIALLWSAAVIAVGFVVVGLLLRYKGRPEHVRRAS